MVSSLFGSAVVAAVLWSALSISTTNAAVHRRHTHGLRVVGRGLEVETYHPPTTFKTFDSTIDVPNLASVMQGGSVQDMASSFLKAHLDDDGADFSYKSGYSSELVHHAYFRQAHGGIPFANAVANVAISTGMKPLSLGYSFVKPSTIPSSTPSIALQDAISTAEKALNGLLFNHPASLEYLARPDGSAALVHVFQIRNDAQDSWYEAFVDAHSGELLSVIDFVAHAEYTVVPIWKTDVSKGLEKLLNPEDPITSPLGWHNNGTTKSNATVGNNVISIYNTDLYPGNWTAYQFTQESGGNLVFDYPYNVTIGPSQGLNLDAARANGFYVANVIHDVYYRYGFTEEAFNFQTSNFGKGGKEDDAVFVSVHDQGGLNNANFATPPDGVGGLCRMYIWDQTKPERDGAMANDILIHENTHGLTNRRVGGGTARCLQTSESGGLGEGWSDMMSDWFQQTKDMKDFITGIYATGNPAGARTFPYSADPKINPLRYSDAEGPDSQDPLHFVGEIWTNMLHVLLVALVKEHGWSDTARTDPTGTEGNVVFLRILMDSLPLLPCNPTFQNARDAIVQADLARYGGKNKCLIWNAFASRGLGVNAKPYVNDMTVPAGC